MTDKNQEAREIVKDIISGIVSFDALEREHIDDVMAWIGSGVEIFRMAKPDIPPKHLVSYFALVDPIAGKILLLDHLKAERWLPSGGHIEPGEHPKETVRREIREELALEADFLSEDPLFITQTVTVGKTAGHTDVSLWYVLRGDAKIPVRYAEEEFSGYRWFGYDEILDEKAPIFDVHMKRFTRKLIASGLI